MIESVSSVFRKPLRAGAVLPVFLTLCGAAIAQDAVWVEKHPLQKPSARAGHAMAYDTSRQEVVLFGGHTSEGDSNETWVWNGMDWTQRFPVTSPPPRVHHWMAYDADRGQVVLFGGANATGFLSDTWTWDGVSWTQKFPPVSPPARWVGQFMAYDAGRARVVLFGGNAPPGCPTCRWDDTWTWDGTTWTQEHPPASPPALSNHAMAYDEIHGETLLFGGIDSSLSAVPASWIWDGTSWTQQTPATSPGRIADARIAADTVRSQLILFGGLDYVPSGPIRPFLDDTWAWNGVEWSFQTLTVHPTERAQHAMAYDSARGQIVLFGGGSSDDSSLDDTWVWEGNNPICDSARAVPSVLWPPNHKLTEVSIAGVSDPQGEAVSIIIDQITQDEPTDGLGDGDTSPDALLQGAEVQIRAERSGAGNGRVYRIHFTASDTEGGTCSGSVSVSVPHVSKTPAIDDGQLYSSTVP